jgi:hypothetical protein
VTRYRSKTLATWLALIGGSLGAHRFYLRGPRDPWAWLHALPTAVGLYGLLRMRALGQDDRLAWLLIPLLGLMLAGTMLMAIVYGLTPDDTWNARWNPQGPPHRTGWITIIGVIVALMVGAGVLMATIAFGGQRIFESLATAQAAPHQVLSSTMPSMRLATSSQRSVIVSSCS